MVMRRRCRGGAMAFYAAFLVTAGLPFMALSLDLSQYWAMRVKLQTATDAACAAYAQYPDIETYIDKGEIKFVSEASAGALMAFTQTMRGKGSVRIWIGASQDEGVPVVYCQGTYTLEPILDLGIDFTARAHAEAKMAILSGPFKN
jgi:hypothetical protein